MYFAFLGVQVKYGVDFPGGGRYNQESLETPIRTTSRMEVEFSDSSLSRLETDLDFNAGFGPEIVRGYRKVLRFIRAAADERDFRAMRSLNFEKLKGDRSHQHSFRLNKQWRLVVEIKVSEPKNTIVVVEIKDYH